MCRPSELHDNTHNTPQEHHGNARYTATPTQEQQGRKREKESSHVGSLILHGLVANVARVAHLQVAHHLALLLAVAPALHSEKRQRTACVSEKRARQRNHRRSQAMAEHQSDRSSDSANGRANNTSLTTHLHPARRDGNDRGQQHDATSRDAEHHPLRRARAAGRRGRRRSGLVNLRDGHRSREAKDDER